MNNEANGTILKSLVWLDDDQRFPALDEDILPFELPSAVEV